MEKQQQKRIEETRAGITTEVKKGMSKLITSKLGEQLQKGREENRAEIISELERERITIMRDFNTTKEDIVKKLENRKRRFPDGAQN